MNHRERLHALLHGQAYDRLPIVHFGWWDETIAMWRDEGHIPGDLAEAYFDAARRGMADGSDADRAITALMGFDYNYFTVLFTKSGLNMLYPKFERKIVRELEGGACHVMNEDGVIVLQKEGAHGIPAEIDHTLRDRASWEEHYKPRLQWSEDRIDAERLARVIAEQEDRQFPLGIYCGSVMGQVRDWFGIEGLSYLYVDDEDLFVEIVETLGELQYTVVKRTLESGARFDFGHFWEDIAFKNGPLVVPSVFDEVAGPIYRRITDLLGRYGIDIVSLDCDGVPDKLLPTWLHNGVNTMFPIEVGTWGGSIAPWRAQFGPALRGVGGVKKHVLALDEAAVDREIERLRPLVALGGYLPCFDHRIPPDAKWELVQYYAAKMREVFA